MSTLLNTDKCYGHHKYAYVTLLYLVKIQTGLGARFNEMEQLLQQTWREGTEHSSRSEDGTTQQNPEETATRLRKQC